jgi:hypothetical protein
MHAHGVGKQLCPLLCLAPHLAGGGTLGAAEAKGKERREAKGRERREAKGRERREAKGRETSTDGRQCSGVERWCCAERERGIGGGRKPD